jgi:hypothetical protein
MTPIPPSSREPFGPPSARTRSSAGRIQRDVRLQAALALVVGVTIVAVPLVLWSRGKKKESEPQASAASASASVDPSPPTVIFGDAGPSVSIEAGGRTVTFGEPRYLKCQDPGPGKTPPERCDHLGAIEELVTKAVVEKVPTCLAPAAVAQSVALVVDVSFKRKKIRMKDGKDGSTMPAAQRKKLVACLEKGLAAPNWDLVGHAHQRYLFQFLATFGPSAPASAPPVGAAAPVGAAPIGAAPLPIGTPPAGGGPPAY